MTDADLCVSCGEIVPEGVMVCPVCRREPDPWFEPDPPKFCKVCGQRANVFYGNPYTMKPLGCENCVLESDDSDWMYDEGECD